MVPAGVDITNPTPTGDFSLQGPAILTTTTLSDTPTTQETPYWQFFFQEYPPGFRFITVSFTPHPGIMATWHQGAI